MQNRFEENCRYFEFHNPRASALLSFATAESLEFCKSECGELNLFDKVSNSYYHAPSGALQEAKAWVETLPLKNDVLTIFGVGLGYSFVALKAWLSANRQRQLIFLEDDLRVVSLFLETELATELLLHPQVHLYYIEDSSEGLQVLQSIAWGTFGKKMQIVALPIYAKSRKKIFEEIKSCLEYEASDTHATLDEYVIYGLPFYRNFWRNLFLMPGSYLGNNLAKAFTGIPAIVVAAGPSLGKHLGELQSLRDRALIFSGGSSVNALLEAGIRPHFGAGIDPNPLQYLRLRQGLAFQTPFFFRHRLLHEAASLISGPRLYLKGGDGYNTSDWFDKKLHIPGRVLGGGHSVANFSVEIAHALGCSPIILVGFDLAFGPDLEHYAPGVAETAIQDEPVVWENRDGKRIYTAWKWLVEARWIEQFAKKKGSRLRLINATEGGLGLKKVKHMTLKEAASRYLTCSYDLDGLVHTACQEAGTCQADHNTILHLCAKMYDSLARSIMLLEKLSELARQRKDVRDTPDFILTHEKLKKETAFQYILEVFDRMKNKLEFYHLQFASHPTQGEDKRVRLELDLLADRFLFLKDVAVTNQLLIAHSVQEQQSLGKSITAFSPKSEVRWV